MPGLSLPPDGSRSSLTAYTVVWRLSVVCTFRGVNSALSEM